VGGVISVWRSVEVGSLGFHICDQNKENMKTIIIEW
jgi:hypothetical protein